MIYRKYSSRLMKLLRKWTPKELTYHHHYFFCSQRLEKMSVYSSTDKPHKSLWKKIISSFLKVILWQCTPLDLVARRGSKVSWIWVVVCLDGSDTSPVAAVWPMTHKAQEMIFLSVSWPPQDTKFSGRNDKTLICWN